MSLTVLAIDDSRTIREMLNAALSEAGFLVHLAVDGQDGLDKLDEAAPDVVITDINMPKLDGFGFIEGARARQDTRAVPILVLTTESAADLKARARDAGATGWIVKPFDEMRLISAIQRVAGLRAAG
ncbi:chemotaxis protein CheY [Defluviimonas sp. 20V17]|uniref:Response regulator n=1 Tax=Allgaiera indica TaxID=765699 RepID=A0AAN4UP77_9RHOB|nr:response regulator [Allgaiera indica]KDB04008.1 chemotaxis protein CheY [Defluviimonas sp. 20V17]GHD99340.1 response regulator [Allgaiera indica]SDW28509.1 two-component system, chemotaxis family, response regulator CheY [Allgaiera indica]